MWIDKSKAGLCLCIYFKVSTVYPKLTMRKISLQKITFSHNMIQLLAQWEIFNLMGEKMGTVAEPILINVMQLFCADNLEHLHNKALVLKMEQVCVSNVVFIIHIWWSLLFSTIQTHSPHSRSNILLHEENVMNRCT